MLWPFKSKKTDESEAMRELESSLPGDLRDFLRSQDNEAISDREFKERLKASTTENQGLQPAVTVEQITRKDKEKTQAESNAFVPLVYQQTERLSQDELREMREFEEYNRKYPIQYAAVENCSDLQADFLKCLSSGSFVDKFTVCNVKNNFYQDCVKFQTEAMYMFDYPAVGSMREKKEIRRRADTLFHKFFSCYDDMAVDEKRIAYAKELRESRDEFYEKFKKW